LGLGSLSLAAEAFDRLHDKQRDVEAFARGRNASLLEKILRRLFKEQWVKEWKRGKKHGLLLSAEGSGISVGSERTHWVRRPTWPESSRTSSSAALGAITITD
jgi:hypothetical protein